MDEFEIRTLVRQLLEEGALDDLEKIEDFDGLKGMYKGFTRDLGIPTYSQGYFNQAWKNGLGHDEIWDNLKGGLDKFHDKSLEKLKDILDAEYKQSRGDSEVADTTELAKVESFDDWLNMYVDMVKSHPQKKKDQEALIPTAKTFVGRLNKGEIIDPQEFTSLSSLGVIGVEGNPKKILFDLMNKTAKDKEKSGSGIDKSDPIEDQVEQVEDNIDELESGMQEIEASIDSALKKNPPPSPSDSEKNKKAQAKFEKYINFLVNRLFRKITEYAESKNRPDVVQIIDDNINVVTDWNHQRREVLIDLIAGFTYDKDGAEHKLTKDSWQEYTGWYEQGINDIAKIVKNIKADPLKKLDAKKITEGFDNYQNLLLEKRVNNQILEFFKAG
jgi:hypothetical protein